MAPTRTEKENSAKPSQSRSRAALTDSQKAERHNKGVRLTTAITDARKSYSATVREIAKEHGRTVGWTKGQLFLGGRYSKQRRGPTAYNAFIREKLAEANEGRGHGARWRLRDFTRAHSETLKNMYYRLTKAQKDKLIDDLTIARARSVKVVRTNTKAMKKDADATFNDMKNDWTAICSRLQLQGFYMAVKTDTVHYHEPKVFFSQGAIKFFEQVLKIPDPRDLALKFEAWVVNRLHEEDIAPQAPLKLPAAISLCRKLLQEGLEQIVLAHCGGKKLKKVQMNYDNYERQIVERYGVALEGWPSGVPFGNPGTIGRENIYKLLAALEGSTEGHKCRWVKLSDADLDARKEQNKQREANGEQVYKPRKARATKQPKSAATVEDTESSDDGSDEE